MNVVQNAFFLPARGGRCFCVYRRPSRGVSRGVVLHLPAFGDEMNKSRVMTARGARAFAAQGFGVLQVDLLGCGDSDGALADATLAGWIDNLSCAIDWLRSEQGVGVEWLWALRSGALLVQPLLSKCECPSASIMLWQPICKGMIQLNQLLRQKAASGMLGQNGPQVASLRQDLREGRSLEIGGYTITPALADDLERAVLDVSGLNGRGIAWYEIDASSEPSLSPAARQATGRLKACGASVTAMSVHGAPFWQSAEIERCDALIEASVAALMQEVVNDVSRDAIAL